jgi:hypothetical protein
MVNLSPEEQERASLVVVILLTLRHQGYSEKDISDYFRTPNTPHRFDSIEHLYSYLRARDVPDWQIYPPGHTGDTKKTPTEKPHKQADRKARSQAALAKMLPPARQAEHLLEAMVTHIRHSIRRASRAETVLRGKRFETWTRLPPPFKEETAALEASEDPPDPLWRLIAMYALSDEPEMFRSSEVRPEAVPPMERLIKALHPRPEEAEREKINRYIEGWETKGRKHPGLKTRAKQVARLVYGSEVPEKGGRPPAEHPPKDMAAAKIVAEMQSLGISDEQIQRELNEQKDTDYSIKDIERLGELGQRAADE